MKNLFLSLILIFLTLPVFAEEPVNEPETELSEISPETSGETSNFVGKDIFGFNLHTGLINFRENKFQLGAGFSYEHEFLKFLSLRLNLDYNLYLFTNDNIRINTIGISVTPLFYPFDQGLKYLYFGIGESTEFFTYKGGNLYIPSERELRKSDLMISVFPEIGWKQLIADYLMVDIYMGWRFPFYVRDTFNYVSEYGTQGFDFGLKFKFNFGKIKNLYTKYKEKKENKENL